MRGVIAVFAAWIMVTACAREAAARRVALVIGNGAYQHSSALSNPANDAKSVAAALRRIAFDDVEVVLDADLTAMHQALTRFARLADRADLALVYYSGHGLEVDGRNYLVPTSAQLSDLGDAQFEAVSLDLALEATNRASKVKLVILDACRDNPFVARSSRGRGSRSISQGLGAVTTGNGMLVAYAAKAGTVADDGSPGGNSPFTAAFLKFVEQPGVDVRRLFGLVRDEVLRTTRVQEPGIYASLGGDEIFLNPGAGRATIDTPSAPPVPVVAAPPVGAGPKSAAIAVPPAPPLGSSPAPRPGVAPLVITIKGVNNTVNLKVGGGRPATGERTIGGVGAKHEVVVSPNQEVSIAAGGVNNLVRAPSSMTGSVKFTADGVDNKIAYY